MSLAACRAALGPALGLRTLCLVVREGQVLLAMKKRGFGVGRWNGPGGKIAPGETLAAAAIRETWEEVGVRAHAVEPIAVLRFYFPAIPPAEGWNQQVHVFLVRAWDGTPAESEEMRPQWFDQAALPYPAMWPDDPLWLPQALAGRVLEGDFLYDAAMQIVDYEVRET
jgi:8-oxo-dGTP pyrophosphatase MutT (NUDIX family)